MVVSIVDSPRNVIKYISPPDNPIIRWSDISALHYTKTLSFRIHARPLKISFRIIKY